MRIPRAIFALTVASLLVGGSGGNESWAATADARAVVTAGKPDGTVRVARVKSQRSSSGHSFVTRLVGIVARLDIQQWSVANDDWLRKGWDWISGRKSFALGVHESAVALREVGHSLQRAAVAMIPSGLLPDLDLRSYRLLTVVPVAGAQSSPYGYRRDPIHRRRKFHKGMDFKADRGQTVRAAAAGVVIHAGRRGAYGRLVVIDHGLGVQSRYAHLHRIRVKKGSFVTARTAVGTVGSSGRSTGPHLHFEVRIDGNPVDPRRAFATSAIAAESRQRQ